MIRTKLKELNALAGQNVRRLRKMAGITEKELGQMIDKTDRQVRSYEKTKEKLSGSTIYLLAQAFGVDMEYFFKEHDLDL